MRSVRARLLHTAYASVQPVRLKAEVVEPTTDNQNTDNASLCAELGPTPLRQGRVLVAQATVPCSRITRAILPIIKFTSLACTNHELQKKIWFQKSMVHEYTYKHLIGQATHTCTLLPQLHTTCMRILFPRATRTSLSALHVH